MVHDVLDQMKPVQAVLHAHVERCGDRALFIIPAHPGDPVEALERESVDQPGIAVEGEDDGSRTRE